MPTYNAKINIQLKEGILDPQGKAVEHALSSLGFAGMEHVRIGKLIELQVSEESVNAARKTVDQACQKLLANPVIEVYNIVIEENGAA